LRENRTAGSEAILNPDHLILRRALRSEAGDAFVQAMARDPVGTVWRGLVARVMQEQRRLSRLRRVSAPSVVRGAEGGAPGEVKVTIDTARTEIGNPGRVDRQA
jgi:hypothetical protein